jgi:acetylornithine deacetylase/succinyl-diaminopimelate desuccinylase-like protein
VTRAFFESMASAEVPSTADAMRALLASRTDDEALKSLNPEIMHAVELLAGEMWPGVPVIPTMSGGYTDSRWLRNAGIPSYGVSGLFTDPVNIGVHGRNEQVGAKELYDSKEFLYRLVKQLAGPNRTTAQ